MRHDQKVRNKARELRSAGKTYSEIMAILNLSIPKSTLSNWCSGVPLPPWYQKKVDGLNSRNLSKAQKMALVSNRLKREEFLRRLADDNSRLLPYLSNKDNLKMLLAFLYLGEGSKWRSHRGLMLGSSDPDIIRLYIRLLKLCYNIDPQGLKCRISYRADQDLVALEKYWSAVTNIPLGSFYKTIPDPRTKGKPTKQKDYKGVCVIMGGATRIQLELELIPRLILEGL